MSLCDREYDPNKIVPQIEQDWSGVLIKEDPVNHPTHYTSHPSGIECIQITEHMNFCIGNAMKYLWRAGLKNDDIEDLKKAVFYVQREISRREKERDDSQGEV